MRPTPSKGSRCAFREATHDWLHGRGQLPQAHTVVGATTGCTTFGFAVALEAWRACQAAPGP